MLTILDHLHEFMLCVLGSVHVVRATARDATDGVLYAFVCWLDRKTQQPDIL